MKAHHIFLAACFAAFALTSCEKEALPEIKIAGKTTGPQLESDSFDPADSQERDIINLGKPVPVDLKNHERRGSTVKADDLEVIDFTDRMDTTIRNGSIGIETQEHERRGVLSVKGSIKQNAYTNRTLPIKPAKSDGSAKVEMISHQ